MPFVSFIFTQFIPKFDTRGLQHVACDGSAVGLPIIVDLKLIFVEKN